jgi:replicative DNA helicase
LPSNELFNEEAENHVLAAILQNPEEYHVVVGSTGLRGSDFVGVESRRIATAIDEVVSERKQPTLPYIIEALRLRGESDTVDYVSRLTSLPCSIDQAIGYANAVRSLSVSRQLGNVGAKIITISREKRTNVEEALTEADSALRKITSLMPASERSPDPKDIIARMKVSGAAEGIPLFFAPSLQRVTGGLRPMEMWVIGGFSSTGKSALAANILLDVMTSRDKRVALFNIEMSQETYMTRLLSIKSGIPQRKIRENVTIGFEDADALDKAERFISRSGLRLYDTIGTIAGIKNEARKIKNRDGLDVIVVDYIQSIRGTRGEEVADAREIAIELQALAKELRVCVVAFSQVSNQFAKDDNAAGGSGDFYSFKGHGAIRDNADVALMIRRNRRAQSAILDIQVAKNRHGELTEFACDLTLETGRIVEREREYDYE